MPMLRFKKPQNKQALISFLNAYIDRAHSVALYGRLFHKTVPLYANSFEKFLLRFHKFRECN